MKNFDIKDLLIHILHGGIILAVAYFSFAECMIKFASGHGLINANNEITEITGIGVTVAILLSYLIGLIIDPIADMADTFLNWLFVKCGWKYMIFPSFHLLLKGTRWGLELAHYAKIREILSGYLEENQKLAEIKDDENGKKKWEEAKYTMKLFNYAKNRAFARANEYQLQRIETYFRLFVFYRNMIWTTISCAAILIVSVRCQTPKLLFTILGAIAAIILFSAACYKYRTYYCRIILGAVYSPKKSKKSKK